MSAEGALPWGETLAWEAIAVRVLASSLRELEYPSVPPSGAFSICGTRDGRVPTSLPRPVLGQAFLVACPLDSLPPITHMDSPSILQEQDRH